LRGIGSQKTEEGSKSPHNENRVVWATRRKDMKDADRFSLAMNQISWKRLTHAELTGKDADALHSPTTGTGQTQPF
jgi:hypothetical protein